jgi:peptidoglycan hydrolase CwlO-like protein
MKDKRTYKNLKEHGEDMSHENESKVKPGEDRGPLDITLLTDQYKADLKKYQDRESIYIQTKNQLDGTKAIVMEMAGTIREVHTQNENLRKEIDRLNEEIQLLEMQIKK